MSLHKAARRFDCFTSDVAVPLSLIIWPLKYFHPPQPQIKTEKTPHKKDTMSSEPLLSDGNRGQPLIYGTVINESLDDENAHDDAHENAIPKEIPHTYENHGPIRTFFIICNLACISLANTAVTGMLIVGIPEIARKLAIPEYLLLW